jgi:hypothetical protein
MKKLFVLLICVLMFTGCATLGTNSGKIANAGIDVAFVSQLQAHPEAKGDIVKGLNNVKLFLNANACTYDELIIEIAKQFPDKYSVYAVVISYYFDCDQPTSTSLLPMLDPYKETLITKIDRLILLTELVK